MCSLLAGSTDFLEKEAMQTESIDSTADSAHPPPASTHGLLGAVSALIRAVNCALSGESNHARQYLSAACLSLEPGQTPDELKSTDEQRPALEKCRGGLAPWQIRCVSTHIEGHLSETIHCEHLSDMVNLSLSHFMRAFRDSFGCPPHAYLIKRRMQRAQGLMLTTNTSLGQIALECGLADQSHLSRLFQRFLGESPAAWRRARHASEHLRERSPDPHLHS
jgi:AraC family transcriptional regulator